MASQAMCDWMQRSGAGGDNPADIDTYPSIQWLIGGSTEQGFQNLRKRSVEAADLSPSTCRNTHTCFWGNSFRSPSAQFNILYRQDPLSYFDVPFLQCPSDYGPRVGFSLSGAQSRAATRTQLGGCDNFDDGRGVSSLIKSEDGHTSMIDFFKRADADPTPVDHRGGCASTVVAAPPFDNKNTGFLSTGWLSSRGDGRMTEDVVSACNNGFESSSVGSVSSSSNAENCTSGRRCREGVLFGYTTTLGKEEPRQEAVGQPRPVAAGRAQKASTRRGTTAPAKGKESKKASGKGSSGGSFPANVKSLLSTGIFDGLCVKYVSWDRKKSVEAVIKGPGYLCGCRGCNFSEVVNAYEMESHAGCKTKHPNGHIYFGNGKTVYEVVQELKSKSEEELLSAICNVTGFGVNDTNFHIWKASYVAANAELKRIYGGDVSSS